MDIAGMADGDVLHPLHCHWCGGLTTHSIKRSMPMTGKNLKDMLSHYDGEFGNFLSSIDEVQENESYVFVTYSCERCKIKVAARRGGQHEHYAIWSVSNWNTHYSLYWCSGMKILKIDNTKRRKS